MLKLKEKKKWTKQVNKKRNSLEDLFGWRIWIRWGEEDFFVEYIKSSCFVFVSTFLSKQVCSIVDKTSRIGFEWRRDDKDKESIDDIRDFLKEF